MPKRKRESTPAPPEAVIHVLEPARGVSDSEDVPLDQVANQLLALPQAQQILAAQWMGTQPEYAGLLGYLLDKMGVSGAVRRALKRAAFELRRQGVQIATSAQPIRESPSISEQWTVEEVFATLLHLVDDNLYPLHMRFFMRHTSGQRAAFLLSIDTGGHLAQAQLVDRTVGEIYEQCLQNQYRPPVLAGAAGNLANEFVSLPVRWAEQVAHEFRRRNLRDHVMMPAHAAFYWGRLPAPPDPPEQPPIDAIPDAETGWMISSLIEHKPSTEVPGEMFAVLLPFTPPPLLLAQKLEETLRESESRIVLTPGAEQEREKQTFDKLRQKLFPDERLREPLTFLLPILGSVILTAGMRQSAVWCKALWRELTERPERPFRDTHMALLLIALSSELLKRLGESREPQSEGTQDEAPSSG